MRVHLSIVVVALALTIPANRAAAQRPKTREGFNISFGGGGGSAGVGCSGCGKTRQSGAIFYLNLGGTVNQRLTLGGELNGIGYHTTGEDVTIGSLMAVAHFYPEATGGFFLTGGGGATSMVITNNLDRTEVSSRGVGLEGGLGYDVRLGRNFSLTPYASYVKGFGGRISYNGVSTSARADPDYLQVGLGFTWH
jgi:hypothetical protein